MSGFRRLPSGGRIDRARPLGFTLDGRSKQGLAGDTLASAVLANGGGVINRSFKYHRPRGVMAAGPEEPNALFTLGSGATQEPNIPGTQAELLEGLAARTQNGWPSVRFDALAINQRFAKVLIGNGFYYKTFMGPRKGSWMLYEPFIRKAAGLGQASTEPDRSRYETRRAFTEVLVVGGGPAGLAAALAAARCRGAGDPGRAGQRTRRQPAERSGRHRRSRPGARLSVIASSGAAVRVTLMTRTTAQGLYDGNTVGPAGAARPPGARPGEGRGAANLHHADRPAHRLRQRRARATAGLRRQRPAGRDAGRRGAGLSPALRRGAGRPGPGGHQQRQRLSHGPRAQGRRHRRHGGRHARGRGAGPGPGPRPPASPMPASSASRAPTACVPPGWRAPTAASCAPCPAASSRSPAAGRRPST